MARNLAEQYIYEGEEIFKPQSRHHAQCRTISEEDECEETKRVYHHGPCAHGYNFVPIVFGLMLYIVYVMECWHSRSKLAMLKKLLCGRVSAGRGFETAFRDLGSIALLLLTCGVYRNGDAVPTTQVYYERVDSHSAGNVFIYDVCGVKDISKSVVDIERFPLTRVRVNRGFVFACIQAAREFEQQRTRFFNENETRDDYMEDPVATTTLMAFANLRRMSNCDVELSSDKALRHLLPQETARVSLLMQSVTSTVMVESRTQLTEPFVPLAAGKLMS
ncbi:hypothetical protein KIN20_010233 [Parelaphostrongylus tenuis]|uniref:Uncharacterized protein n=1 Tax=Parelaphostrongylus tenuis TaxID=148309 RepID=A0AAD5M7K7_PARTN|nr:hypothetical protein KIN20_010233 [Parelaphostrongylus tenuis]